MTAGPVDLTEDELRQGLTACLNVSRWVDDVVSAGPYASLGQLLEVARDAASPLSPAEIDQALADHPRIGERARAMERPRPSRRPNRPPARLPTTISPAG